jgi:PAS domain S-box-containing protein
MNRLSDFSQPNILIVDDDPEQLEYLEVLIAKQASPVAATSGFEGIRKATGNNFALALVDVKMPGMNGYDFAIALNKDRVNEKIPVIFLTSGPVNPEQIIEGYESGAVDYIPKPVNKYVLQSKVNIFIDLFRQKQTILANVAELKQSSDVLAHTILALKKSEEKFRNYINHAPNGIFVADETGKYIEVNEAACRITGYSMSELLRMNITDILASESLLAGIEHFNQTILNGEAMIEIQYKHKNKGLRWWLVNSVKITPSRLLAFVQDITERREDENQLRELSERYQSLFENSLLGAGLAEPNGQIITCNKAFADLLGYSIEEMQNLNSGSFYSSKKDREEILIQLYKNKTVKDYESVLITKDNRLINVLLNISVININGKPMLQTTCLDITKLKHAAKDLKNRVSYEHAAAECTRILALSDVLDNMLDQIIQILIEITHSDRVYIFINSYQNGNGLCASLKFEICGDGISPQLNNPTLQNIPYLNISDEFYLKLMSGRPFAYLTKEVDTPSKNIHFYQDVSSILVIPIFSGSQFWGFMGFDDCKAERIWKDDDINLLKLVAQTTGTTIQRKLIEEELRKSEELFRSVVFNSHDLTVLTDAEGIIVFISPQCESVLGYPNDSFLGVKMPEITHPDDTELCRDFWRRVFFGVGEQKDFEYRILDQEGSVRWISHSSKAVKVNETIIGFQNTIRNITERKNSEQALRVSEEKYRTMLNASPDGIFITNLKGIITDVSEIGLELYGSDSRNDLAGKHFMRFVPRDEKPVIREIIEKTLIEGLVQNVEIKIRRKNQSFFLSETSATLIQGPDGAPVSFMIIIRDISQRKRIEKKQIHADRMASLGEMASGIAHEINQPLNTISLALDNVVYEAQNQENIDKEYLKKKSDKIFENIARIRNIIDHVRAFSSSHDDYVLTGFDINTSIKNAVSMISEQFKHRAINLNLKLEDNLPLILGNTFKFEQVILNLLANAKDAVLDKKNILTDTFEMLIQIRSFQENEYIHVEIDDNGTGISEEDIDHIMLPFYTTKDAGKGTGLGLSISYQIIKEMNGNIEISSNLTMGTTFKILLKNQK